jgi:hypothetical protein
MTREVRRWQSRSGELYDRAKLLVVWEGPEIPAASEPGHLQIRHSQFNGGRGNQGTQFTREEWSVSPIRNGVLCSVAESLYFAHLRNPH